jgi:hypothetical protein
MLRPIRSALGTNRVKYKDCATAISLNVSDWNEKVYWNKWC